MPPRENSFEHAGYWLQPYKPDVGVLEPADRGRNERNTNTRRHQSEHHRRIIDLMIDLGHKSGVIKQLQCDVIEDWHFVARRHNDRFIPQIIDRNVRFAREAMLFVDYN